MANSESKNTQNGRFWNFFFRKKKKNSSPKRANCGCCESYQGTKIDKNVQTNTLTDNEEEKLPKLNVNMYGNPKDIQKHGECPGKIYPLERRGCGFHLYFCIDNMKKSDIARNKIIKKLKCEKSNNVDSFQGLEVNKRTISSETEASSLAQRVANSPPKLLRGPSKKIVGRELSPSDTPGLTETTTTVKTHRNQEEILGGKANSILRARKTSSNMSLTGNVYGVPPGKATMVRISSTETPITTYGTKSGSGVRNPTDHPTSFIGADVEEDSVFKEYEVLRRQKSKRKSTRSRAGSTFVRNSLISVRKDRRSSIDIMVPQILSKLCNIEEKITELEKVCEDRGKNITNIVGISCAKSTLSVDIKSRNSKDELNKHILPQNSPSKHNTTVVIKSHGEDVVVNAPENVSVIKKMRSRQGSSQLVYHNTQELDAHSIASNSFRKTQTIKRQNSKAGAEETPQSVEATKNRGPDKWRRISEQLKILNK